MVEAGRGYLQIQRSKGKSNIFLRTAPVLSKECIHTKCRWLMPVILANQESEIRGSWFEASPDK
jgi:hypothetical protein